MNMGQEEQGLIAVFFDYNDFMTLISSITLALAVMGTNLRANVC